MGVWVRSQSSNWLVFASEFYIKTKNLETKLKYFFIKMKVLILINLLRQLKREWKKKGGCNDK